jgi:hypothetical protein
MNLREIGCGGANWIQFRIVQVARFCEHGNEPSGSIKERNIIQLSKEDPASCREQVFCGAISICPSPVP